MTAMLWRSFHAFRSGMKSEIRCSACVFDGFLLHTVTQSHFHSKQVAKQAAIAFSYQLHIAEKQSAGESRVGKDRLALPAKATRARAT